MISNFIPKKKSIDKIIDQNKDKSKNCSVTNVNTLNENNTISSEDLELLNRSKTILKAKSKFYDRMCATGGSLNSEDNCLVMFNEKRQMDKGVSKYYSDSDSSSEEDQSAPRPDQNGEDWVEYTDCLGRTRKCLKEDVEFFKKKDMDLAETVQKRKDENFVEPAPKWILDTKGDEPEKTEEPTEDGQLSDDDDALSMISKTSKMEDMRLNWEKQEQENIQKDYVHYQNVLFDGKN